jgi:hypothetical protein
MLRGVRNGVLSVFVVVAALGVPRGVRIGVPPLSALVAVAAAAGVPCAVRNGESVVLTPTADADLGVRSAVESLLVRGDRAPLP